MLATSSTRRRAASARERRADGKPAPSVSTSGASRAGPPLPSFTPAKHPKPGQPSKRPADAHAGRCRREPKPRARLAVVVQPRFVTPFANSWTIGAEGRQVVRRRLVMMPSVTTSSSTTSAPALRRSVRTLGHDVSRRPRATSASTKFHGPWQIDATGLPDWTKSRTNAPRRVHPQLVRVHRPARQQQRVVVVDRRRADEPVDPEGAGRVEVVVAGLDLAARDGQDVGRAPASRSASRSSSARPARRRRSRGSQPAVREDRS